jgi:hypothetical protein
LHQIEHEEGGDLWLRKVEDALDIDGVLHEGGRFLGSGDMR